MVLRPSSTKAASTTLRQKSTRINSSDLVNEIVDQVEIGMIAKANPVFRKMSRQEVATFVEQFKP